MAKPTIVVPDFLGEFVHIAREIAARSGLDLCADDLDGPPLASLTQSGYFRITAQDPPPASHVQIRHQVRIKFEPFDPGGDGVPRPPSDSPPGLAAKASKVESLDDELFGDDSDVDQLTPSP